jgi:hypothetical protein
MNLEGLKKYLGGTPIDVLKSEWKDVVKKQLKNETMNKQKFPLVAESKGTGLRIRFTSEHSGAVVKPDTYGVWKKGDCSDTLVSCSIEDYWTILASPQAEDKDSIRPQFPLIAKSKTTERVVCFTDKENGVVIKKRGKGALYRAGHPSNKFGDCPLDDSWEIITTPESEHETSRTKPQFPLISKDVNSETIVCFTSESVGIVVKENTGFFKLGEKIGTMLPCSDKNSWQIIASPEIESVKNETTDKQRFPLIAVSKNPGRMVCFINETEGVVVKDDEYYKIGDSDDGFESRFNKDVWHIIAMPKSKPLKNKTMNKEKFPLIAKAVNSEIVTYFTSENVGIVVIGDAANDFYIKGEQYDDWIYCFDKAFWQIIAIPETKPIKKETANKEKFPLLAKNKYSGVTICFTSENLGVVIQNEDNTRYPLGDKSYNFISCFNETYWQIIAEPESKPAKTKEFEVETCECGKEVPIESMVICKDGSRICSECRMEQLEKIIENVRIDIN